MQILSSNCAFCGDSTAASAAAAANAASVTNAVKTAKAASAAAAVNAASKAGIGRFEHNIVDSNRKKTQWTVSHSAMIRATTGTTTADPVPNPRAQGRLI